MGAAGLPLFHKKLSLRTAVKHPSFLSAMRMHWEAEQWMAGYMLRRKILAPWKRVPFQVLEDGAGKQEVYPPKRIRLRK